MLEKHSNRTIAAIALLASLAILLSFQLGNSMTTPAAYSEEEEKQLDRFGVKKIYPTAQGGNEWYVNMEDPASDPMFRNLETMRKQSDGSWQVDGGSNGQVRLEAWSPANEKWLNVEITMYAKMVEGSNELLQMYSRGGHHTSRDECLGSAYKARLYGDGMAAWNKEITHPAYAGNRAETRATTEPLEDRWIGFKAVIYNFVDEEDGNTYVRLESYIDDNVTDEDGNLVVANNWKLASVYEDRGGWATNDSDFDSSCGRDRDEILTLPGGTDTQNIAAWRSDDLTWSFKYLSVREIDPTRTEQESVPPVPEEEDLPKEEHTSVEPLDETERQVEEPSEEPQDPMDNICSTEYCILVSSKQVENDGTLTEITSLDLNMKKSTLRASGTVTVAIVQGSDVLTTDTISTSEISTTYVPEVVQFGIPANVQGANFDIVVTYEGSGLVSVSSVGVPA